MKGKYTDRLLVLTFIFIFFFFLTAVVATPLLKVLHLETNSRYGLLTTSVIQNIIAFIIPSFVIAKFFTRRASEFLCLKTAPNWKALIGVVIIYILGLPFLNQLIYWNSNIHFPEALSGIENALRETELNIQAATSTMLDTTSIGGLMANLLIIALLTAFAEEIFFRGILQTTIATNGRRVTAIWITAVIFSAFHFQALGFFPRLLLGAWFGYLLYWTRSLYAPVFAHFINNGTVVVCTWLTLRGSNINFEMLGVSESGFPIMAIISCILIALFLCYFKNIFFNNSKSKKISENNNCENEDILKSAEK